MYKNFFKRLIDILSALVGIPVFIIIFLVVAPFIKFTDKGPVFYCAKRIGKNEKLFKMLKFRSMMVNAPDIRLSDGSTYNGSEDPRVTKIGKFLRKTSLDEIPQIINVLMGNMSFIGPRPDPPDWLDKYPDEIKIFLSMRPGITGYNQAYFRNSADGKEKMKNDAFYAVNCNFILDVKIFLRTIGAVLKRENTYKTVNIDQVSNMAELDFSRKY